MNYDDFDRIVQEVYGCDFELVADQELHNDMSWTASSINGEPDPYDELKIEALKSGKNVTWVAYAVLEDLVKNNYLPAGDYVIDICW